MLSHLKSIPVGVEVSKSQFGLILSPFEACRGPKKVFLGCFWTMNPMFIMDIDLGSNSHPETSKKSIPVGVEGSKLSIWANFESSWGLQRGSKKVYLI